MHVVITFMLHLTLRLIEFCVKFIKFFPSPFSKQIRYPNVYYNIPNEYIKIKQKGNNVVQVQIDERQHMC